MDWIDLICALLGYYAASCGKGLGKVVGSCECGNEPKGSIKCGEFLD
jgi:hypothetical protein